MKSRKFILLYTAIIVVHILLILYYGLQKEGFHEDDITLISPALEI